MSIEFLCICTICGIRNDKDNPESICRNGHNSWLEFGDFYCPDNSPENKATLRKACSAFGMKAIELEVAFLKP